jgi:hypothetical protein
MKTSSINNRELKKGKRPFGCRANTATKAEVNSKPQSVQISGEEVQVLVRKFGFNPKRDRRRIVALYPDLVARRATRQVVPDQPGADEADGPFPIEVLPPVMRSVVLDVSRLYGIPPALAACCALIVAGASLRKGLKMPTAPGLWTTGNLYALVSAASAAGKSNVYG